jgi:hypothetical protein
MPLVPCLQTTPPSNEMVVPHSGGSEGAPMHRTHLCALHAVSSSGHPQNPVVIDEISASYRCCSDTLAAAPSGHAQPPLQILPVAMEKQSELWLHD